MDAIVRVEITPGERFAHMIETLFGLAREGHVNKRGMPHPLQLALFATEFSDVIVFRKPPAIVQRVLFGALAPIARRRGYRATYPRCPERRLPRARREGEACPGLSWRPKGQNPRRTLDWRATPPADHSVKTPGPADANRLRAARAPAGGAMPDNREVSHGSQVSPTAPRHPQSTGAARRTGDSDRWRDPRYQAFALMRLAFTVAPIAFGLDKFFNVMVHWPNYLAPWINDIAPGTGQQFMYFVGVTEILAGVIVALKPRYGAYVVAAWLGGHHPQPPDLLRLLRHRPARLRAACSAP